MRKHTHTDEQVMQALRYSRGILSIAARYLTKSTGRKVDRSTLSTRIKNNPQLAQYRRQLEETLKDVAEHHLTQGIENGDPRFVNFYLSTKAKDRGYTRRDEITGVNGGAIRVRPDFTTYTDEQLEQLEAIHREAQANAAKGAAGSDDSDAH